MSIFCYSFHVSSIYVTDHVPRDGGHRQYAQPVVTGEDNRNFQDLPVSSPQSLQRAHCGRYESQLYRIDHKVEVNWSVSGFRILFRSYQTWANASNLWKSFGRKATANQIQQNWRVSRARCRESCYIFSKSNPVYRRKAAKPSCF